MITDKQFEQSKKLGIWADHMLGIKINKELKVKGVGLKFNFITNKKVV